MNAHKLLIRSIVMFFAIICNAQAEVCFLPDEGMCSSTRILSNVEIEIDCAQNRLYSTESDCKSKIDDNSLQTCSKDGKCWVKTCIYKTLEDCKRASGKSTCNMEAKTGCYYPATMCSANLSGGQYYPYLDDNLNDCPFIKNMGTAAISGKNYYRIGQFVPGLNYDENYLKCSTTLCSCSSISTMTIIGSVKNKYCYTKNGVSNEYTDVVTLYREIAGSHSCPADCLVCDESKGYAETMTECENKYGIGNCERFNTGTNNHYCYRRAFRCEYGTFASLSCGSHEVKIATSETSGGSSCGKCVCETGYDDLETCNNWLACQAGVIKNMYNGKSCATLGYNLAKSEVSGYAQGTYECTACPFDGNKWRCQRKN